MPRFLAVLLSIVLFSGVPQVRAEALNPAQAYVERICSLNGKWTGRFDLHNETGVYRSWPLNVSFACFPDNRLLYESRTFVLEDGTPQHTLVVIFPTGEPDEIQMSYFGSGREGIYFFNAALLGNRATDSWTITREAAEKTSESDRNPPISRYTHIRSGNALTMTREIKTDRASPEWTLSSKFVLTLQP